MRRRILFFSEDFLPLEGSSVSGGGIRSWGLVEGLRSRGHEVLLSFPKEKVSSLGSAGSTFLACAHQRDPDSIERLLCRVNPDILLFEQWGLATYLRDTGIPTVIDLHGSLILENAHRSHSTFTRNACAKIKALRHADLVLCPSERQKRYFLPWLLMSGADPLEGPLIEVVPISLPPEVPARKENSGLRFVFGGQLWPWIDPFPALTIAARVLESAGEGELHLFARIPEGVESPHDSRFTALAGNSTAIRNRGFLPHDILVEEYCQAAVAVDVWAYNYERDLAASTRTAEYLWCGLPVVCSSFSSFAEPIARADAGWIVDPTDEQQLERTFKEILEHREQLPAKSRNAQQLAEELFAWTRTIEPVDAFCHTPTRRRHRRPIFDELSLEFERIETELEQRNFELERRLQHLEKTLEQRQDQIHRLNIRREEEAGAWNTERARLLARDDGLRETMESQQQQHARRIEEHQQEIHRLNVRREEDTAAWASERTQLHRRNAQLQEETEHQVHEHACCAERHRQDLRTLAEDRRRLEEHAAAVVRVLQDRLAEPESCCEPTRPAIQRRLGQCRGTTRAGQALRHYFWRWPKLLILFAANAAVQLYLLWWERRNRGNVLPGQLLQSPKQHGEE
ncbi:glycosyltransferase [Planctomycetota bacterium]